MFRYNWDGKVYVVDIICICWKLLPLMLLINKNALLQTVFFGDFAHCARLESQNLLPAKFLQYRFESLSFFCYLRYNFFFLHSSTETVHCIVVCCYDYKLIAIPLIRRTPKLVYS